MKKINFVNNSDPDLSAETLNQMQDNIEEVGVAVSSTEPITGEKVWIDNTNNTIKAENKNGEFTTIYDESKVVTKEEVLNSYDSNGNTTKPYSAKYINDRINIRAIGFNCGSTGSIQIPNVNGRGCILVNITKNAGVAYGIYSIWFNNGTILRTSKIAGEGDGLNSASLSGGVLTLNSEVWSIGFYVLYCEN